MTAPFQLLGQWISAAHAANEIDLEALARQAGLSVYHCLRMFSSVLGITPHQYLLRRRVARAARLLADGDELGARQMRAVDGYLAQAAGWSLPEASSCPRPHRPPWSTPTAP